VCAEGWSRSLSPDAVGTLHVKGKSIEDGEEARVVLQEVQKQDGGTIRGTLQGLAGCISLCPVSRCRQGP
jgi:hypothetical protein